MHGNMNMKFIIYTPNLQMAADMSIQLSLYIYIYIYIYIYSIDIVYVQAAALPGKVAFRTLIRSEVEVTSCLAIH